MAELYREGALKLTGHHGWRRIMTWLNGYIEGLILIDISVSFPFYLDIESTFLLIIMVTACIFDIDRYAVIDCS